MASSSLVKVWYCFTYHVLQLYISTNGFLFFIHYSIFFCQAAVFGRDPNWGRIACSVGYSGVQFDADQLDISLGVIPLMKNGQPLPFDRLKKLWLHINLKLILWITLKDYNYKEYVSLSKAKRPTRFLRSAASKYLKDAGDIHGTVNIDVSVGKLSTSLLQIETVVCPGEYHDVYLWLHLSSRMLLVHNYALRIQHRFALNHVKMLLLHFISCALSLIIDFLVGIKVTIVLRQTKLASWVE